MKISAVLVTYNEKKKLPGALDSIKDFVDEIVVVDLGSKDKTLEEAKKYQAKVFTHSFVPYVELVRNSSVSKAEGDWILVLDPDERIQPSLKEELKRIIKEDRYDAVNIPRKNIFFGVWIAHTNWWPDRHVRFFKKGKVRWSKYIHVYPQVSGKVFNLAADPEIAIIHYGYDTLSQFFTRQNRYSEIEAKNRFELGERFSWWNFFWRPAREFLARYVRHAGILDGFYGLALTYFMIIYQLSVQVKLWEMEKK